MAEIDTLRRQTAQYIAHNPLDVVLMRKALADDGAGGATSSPTPLAPQTVRIVQQRESTATERRNSAGEVVRPSLVLLATYDADVAVDDTFTWEGYDAEVVWVTDMNYELSCEVALR